MRMQQNIQSALQYSQMACECVPSICGMQCQMSCQYMQLQVDYCRQCVSCMPHVCKRIYSTCLRCQFKQVMFRAWHKHDNAFTLYAVACRYITTVFQCMSAHTALNVNARHLHVYACHMYVNPCQDMLLELHFIPCISCQVRII